MKQFLFFLLTLLIVVSISACGSPATANTTATPALDSSSTASTTETAIASGTSSAKSTTETTAATTSGASASPTSEAADNEYKQIGAELMASESLGAVKIGMTDSELTEALGEPDSKALPSVFAADGKNHADWTYQAKGLRINMVGEDTSGSVYKVYSINAVAPCDFATKKGIKIGDAEDAVIAEYGYAVEDNVPETMQNAIVAGSIYGGVIFGITEEKVALIYIGSATK